ncbi:MAG: hypothetical protein HZB33_00225 [Nitrospirae bacterium]|nr:hypothetical protein [Nitrospirota bacterium]
MKKILLSILALVLTVIVPVIDLHAAAMTDYCMNPPFIVGGVTPNLLMLIDNSSSMFDLSYLDKGNVSGATINRKPYYCYDETYNSGTTYVGYFESDQNYEYDFANNYFYVQTAAFPGFCDKFIANQLCINGTPATVTRFVAKGNYMNWLTASKFDIEKQILTGGKYIEGQCSVTTTQSCYTDADCQNPACPACGAGETCTGRLQAESRGCVGRSFIKEALTADFVNYIDNPIGTGTDPNNSLGITFGVHGPVDATNPTAVSKGGLTTIDIFVGDYDQSKCQAAVEAFETGASKAVLTGAISSCIGYTSSNRNTCQYNQSIICTTDADCGYSLTPGTCGGVAPDGICGPLGGGICTATTAGTCNIDNGACPASGAANGTCVGGSKNGFACTKNANCTGGGTCTRYCVGGGRAGAVCGTNNGSDNSLCAFSACTTGDIGKTPCAVAADCDLKTCTNPGKTFGLSCVVPAGCNSGSCTAGLPATTSCLINADCNSGVAHCTAGQPPATICTANSDCDLTVTGFGQCLPPADVQIKSTYGQSMHSCYQYLQGTPNVPGSDEVQQVTNNAGCSQIYTQYKTCLGGSNDGKVCTTLGVTAECPGVSATCINGPNAIRPGSPVLLCSTSYAGYCASTTDNWLTTTWRARQYASADECVKEMYEDYCNAADVPPVVDPTDAPSDTSQFSNLPAILSDIGIGGQLGQWIKQLNVLVKPRSEPKNVLQEFSGLIRMGAMTFNYNGTASECNKYCTNDHARTCTVDTDCSIPAPAGTCTYPVPCPLVCSNDATKVCKTSLDCSGGGTCSVKDTKNMDGGQIINYVEDSAGTHYSGLIKAIDDISASSWTPYAEAFTDAMGFLARRQTCSNNPAAFCSKDADCPGGTCLAPKYCSNDQTFACNNDSDCVFGFSSGQCNRFPSRGFRFNAVCSTTTTTACSYDSQCPAGERCVDYDLRRNPSQYKCQANNILLITDGMSTADRNSSMNALVSVYNDGDGFTTTNATAATACPKYGGSRNLDDLAWLAKNRNIKTFSTAGGSTAAPSNLSEFITTHVVFTGEEDTTQADECNPKTLMSQTATNGGTSLYNPTNPTELRENLTDALKNISSKSASGTAASVLASGEGSGANIVQAIFFPSRQVGATKIDWTGILQNLWYFIDPQLSNSSIREDSNVDKVLEVKSDCLSTYVFDTVTSETKARLQLDANGDGIADANCPRLAATPDPLYTSFDTVKNLWEAGSMLFSRAASDRTIYTNLNPTNATLALTSFVDTNAAGIRPFLNLNAPYNDNTNASAVINYVRGVDGGTVEGNTTRNRTITIGTETKPWKLGDIVNSTPRIQSWTPLNLYHEAYGDVSYKEFVSTNAYKSRGMVYAGGNDGILHAFKLGLLGVVPNETDVKASLGAHCSVTTSRACICRSPLTYPCAAASANPSCPGVETCVMDSDLGKEAWGFIPKHALPYLKYMADGSYCHIYSIDATPFLFDASIAIDNTVAQPAACNSTEYWKCNKTKDSWKTVLIGSMRLGGACRDIASTCADCIKTPSADLGFSSYFALDVTDPSNPALMWEYSNPDLGMSTSGPSLIKINNKKCSLTTATFCNTDADCPPTETCKGDSTANGRWFVLLGNGPNGYVNPAAHQFLGITSHYDNAGNWHQNTEPRLFVLDLKDGSLQTTLGLSPSWQYHSGFVGSIVNSVIDLNRDYSDDAMYFGYTRTSRDSAPGRFDSVGVSNFHPDGAMTGNNQLNFKETVAWPNSNVPDAYKGSFIEIVDSTNRWMTRLISAYDIAKRCNVTTATTCKVNGDCPAGENCVAWKKVMTLDTPLPTTLLFDSWYVFPGWTEGGVARLFTKNDLNPANWAVSPLITNTGPVTTSVGRLLSTRNNILRLYFGTGRYYYKINGILDDANSQRKLFGLIEPCYSVSGLDTTCTTAATAPLDTDSQTVTNVDNWYIPLDPAGTGYTAERVTTDTTTTRLGAVFFTTSKPSDDVCSYGGVTHLWGVRYDTGGAIPAGVLKGKAIVQLSTGAIDQISLDTAFTERIDTNTNRGRRSAMLQGAPPASGAPPSGPPPPIDTIFHIRKK